MPAAAADAARRPRGGVSYVRGVTHPPLLECTVHDLLAQTAAAHGEREAAVFAQFGMRWTYDDLMTESQNLAAALLALGLAPGDRLGIWSPNRPEWLAAQVATAQVGVILVNINPAYRLAELEYALNQSGCKALICAAQFKSSDYLGMLNTLAPELAACKDNVLRAEKLPHLRTVIRTGAKSTPGMWNYDDALKQAQEVHHQQAREIAGTLSPYDAINIQYTSGTTGAPKGATLTHHNIVNNARAIAEAMHFTEQDALCIPVPLYHCFGMVLGNLACISAGAKMVFPGEGFDAAATLRTVAAERCTALHGVAAMFIAQLEHADFPQCDLSSLRTGIMAGGPCPVEVMKRVTRDMHMREITIAYGMTETSPVSFQSDADDPLEKRVSTVGRILPHIEVKLIHPETGETVPTGETGELCTRGYSVMRGYWNDDARTAEAIDAEGWMHTGDLATLDADGYCNIVGRVKDMLIRGGENVYPREVEEFLYRHPAVQAVQVFGVPDEKYGEEVAAWVVRKANAECAEEDIRAFCRGQIAHYKIPRYVRFVEDFPMTVTGKPQKYKMRAMMCAELNLTEGKTA